MLASIQIFHHRAKKPDGMLFQGVILIQPLKKTAQQITSPTSPDFVRFDVQDAEKKKKSRRKPLTLNIPGKTAQDEISAAMAKLKEMLNSHAMPQGSYKLKIFF